MTFIYSDVIDDWKDVDQYVKACLRAPIDRKYRVRMSSDSSDTEVAILSIDYKILFQNYRYPRDSSKRRIEIRLDNTMQPYYVCIDHGFVKNWERKEWYRGEFYPTVTTEA